MTGRLLAISAVDHPGGAEVCMLRLVRGLIERGWTVTCTTPGEGLLAQQARAAGADWSSLPLGGLERGAGARAVQSFPRAWSLARSASVVYLNGTVAGRLLPVLRGADVRKVLHVHDMVRRVPPFWRWADLVLAASGAVAERLRELGDLEAAVVYGPVDPDPPAVAAPWPAVARGGPVVGFIGRIERRKGPLDLVRAAPAIRAGAPGVRIVIVGDDPYDSDPAYLREVISSPEIEHIPWVDNAPGVMRHLDVLVLPSYEEPFGTVLSEAMAVGTPVVATAVDGLPEVVQDGVSGRLVTPGRPDELAAAVLDVLGRRADMSAAAREHARRFHTDVYVDQIERLVLGVAA
jgi:glycosyltransferase involved in cell wall biosynthesis